MLSFEEMTIKGNLRKLLEGGYRNVDTGCTLKVQKLLEAGWSVGSVASGVSLLPDVEWSTIAVEQGHGSCAVLHRFHTDMEQHILANRSMLRQPIRLRRPHLLLGVTAATPGKDSCCNSSDL